MTISPHQVFDFHSKTQQPSQTGKAVATTSTHLAVINGEGRRVWVKRRQSLEDYALSLLPKPYFL